MPASSKAKKQKSPELFPEQPLDLLEVEHAALRSGVSHVAGVDEAGRGPLAGPVVAATVNFPAHLLWKIPPTHAALNETKNMRPKKPDRNKDALQNLPDLRIGVAVLQADEIDRLNILRATHRAMAQALQTLDPLPELALVDGLPVPGLPCTNRNIVRGDARCLTIAAASIIAKVTRDRLMQALDQQYPVYGFARHKGYGTRLHLEALQNHGPCPAHRRSFAPVRNCETAAGALPGHE
ncbi:MAG: ribonuclease HII [Verrucomicrobia bacterium]|nr:ribonuclease HII [Verrucomicrobiota bacterium]